MDTESYARGGVLDGWLFPEISLASCCDLFARPNYPPRMVQMGGQRRVSVSSDFSALRSLRCFCSRSYANVRYL